MKVPVKKKSGKIKDGVVEGASASGIVYTINTSNRPYLDMPFVTLDNLIKEGGGYYTYSSAREAEKFFHNLANVLEGKPQVD